MKKKLLFIYIFAAFSFPYSLYWLLVKKTGVGIAYTVDQLLPFLIALFFFLFIIRKMFQRDKIKKILKTHGIFLLLITTVTLVIHSWTLQFYFFGEEPTSNLIAVTNNQEARLVTGSARGWHLSMYIASYLAFGTHAFLYNIVSLITYLAVALVLYGLLYFMFNKRFIAFMGTLFFVTTPAYLDTFHWQMNIDGMSLALLAGLLTLFSLFLFHKTQKNYYYFASLLLYIAVLKISFVRMFAFIIPLSFIAFFPNFSFRINVKKSISNTFPFILILFIFLFTVFLIPDKVFERLLYSWFPQLNTASMPTTITVRGDPIKTDNYFLALSTLISYLFVPSQFAKDVFPSIHNFLFRFSSGFLTPSIAYGMNIAIFSSLMIITILGITRLREKLRWIFVFSMLYIIGNLFAIPLFTQEFHDIALLDVLFSTTAAGSGPGSRYVFIASIGMSLLICLLLVWLFGKRKKIAVFSCIVLFLVYGYYAVINIQNHQQTVNDMTNQWIVPDKVFAMVSRDKEKKLLFSSNPARNAIETKLAHAVDGTKWLYAFYTFDELTYTNNLPDFSQEMKKKSYEKSNIFAFYNNPQTNAFADISQLVRTELSSDTQQKPKKLFSSVKTHSSIISSGNNEYPWLIQRGIFISPDISERFFLPKDLKFTIHKQVNSLTHPYIDALTATESTNNQQYPLSLWTNIRNAPLLTLEEIEHKREILAIPFEEKLPVIDVINEREKFRQKATVKVSDIEKENNQITPHALFDGAFIPKNDFYAGLFYRPNRTPTQITVQLPETVVLGRILLHVPSDNPQSHPQDLSISADGQLLASHTNMQPGTWSPTDGGLYEVPLEQVPTTVWEIDIQKTSRNPVMLDEIILDPVEAIQYTPEKIDVIRQASFYSIENDLLAQKLLENSAFNALTIFYACAEDQDWIEQKKDFSVAVPGIWKAQQVALSSADIETVHSSLDCYGSILRKIIFIMPAYPAHFTIDNIVLERKKE